MMEEVSSEEHLPEKLADAKIADELQEAALTNVTQAVPALKEGTPPRTSQASSSSSILSNIPPPSELPPEYTTPIKSYTPSLSSGIASPLGPSNIPPPAPITVGLTLPSSVGPLSTGAPPPPSTGFIPSKGIVSATPIKQAFNPTAPATTPTSAMFNPSGVASLPTVGNSPSTDAPVYTPPPSIPQYTSPTQVVTGPREATLDLEDPSNESAIGPVYPESKPQGGLFGWLSGRGIVSKVVEKTKSSVETMITTLDPGMKEVIYSGGDINILVTSTKEVKVGAIRQAFQEIFGRATITGVESQPNIAPQPIGYTAGLKGAEERIENLRQRGNLPHNQVTVSIESFIVELLPDKWYDIGCVLLKDSVNHIELELFTQSTPIPLEYIERAQEQTPHDYNLRWSGLAVTVGQVINQQMPYVDMGDWHSHMTGVSRRQMLYVTAKALAGMYKNRLPYVPPQPSAAR